MGKTRRGERLSSKIDPSSQRRTSAIGQWVDRMLELNWDQNRRPLAFGALIVLGLLSGLYGVRMDDVAGQMSDDAWYIVLAKALAEGEGYTLINSPSPGIMPLYPPGFPFLLSLAWRLAPSFPENVWLLKSVSIIAMLGVASGIAIYFHRERKAPAWVAIGMALAVVSSPAFVFLASSTVMAECVFTFAQLLAIWVIERTVRSAREGATPWRVSLWIGLGSALSISAFMIRSIAIVLVPLAILYLLRHRLVRLAAIFALTSLLFTLPWLIYSNQHRPTPEQRAEQNSYIVQSYAENFWFRLASHERSGRISLDELPTRMLTNLNTIFEFDMGAILVYPFYRALEPKEILLYVNGNNYLGMGLSLLVLIGYGLVLRRGAGFAELLIPATLLVVLLWPFFPFRFLLPLAPWFLYYVLEAVRAVHGWFTGRQWREGSWACGLLIPLLLAGIHLGSHVRYQASLAEPDARRPNWVRMFQENQRVFAWLRSNVQPSGGLEESAVASNNPGMIYLYTDLKTVGSTRPAEHWELWKRLGVRFYAIVGAYPDTRPEKPEERFEQKYISPGTNFRVVDFGRSSSRSDWME